MVCDMDKFKTSLEELSPQEQKAIRDRLQQLYSKAVLISEQTPNEFIAYIDKALKECEETMMQMIDGSSDVCNDMKALSFIYVIHKERKEDLLKLKDQFLQKQPKGNTPEPQQEQTEQEKITPTIPTIYDADKEKLVFGNALQKQYMSLNNGCYNWILTKSLLAYMCGRLYCGDRIKEDESDYSKKYIKGSTQMPAQEVKTLFGVDVASNRYSLKVPPRNSWKVDELFKNNGASK